MEQSKENIITSAGVLHEILERCKLKGATWLRETAAGMDGFEAWLDSCKSIDYWTRTQQAYLAGRASVSADLDALTDEAERCWRLAARIERVRDMLAAPKEGK